MKNFWQSILVGLKRRWRRATTAALSMLGSIWLATEVLTRVSSSLNQWLDDNGILYLAAAAAAAAIAFVCSAFEARSVTFLIPNTDTFLTLKFSDIFAEDADWIIGVNELFDSTIGNIVAANSLHGQVISKIYNGNEAAFRQEVDAALAAVPSQTVQRAAGQTEKYPLGTTAVLPRGNRKLYLVAISSTNLATNRSQSTVPTLWDALRAAFHMVDTQGNGAPLALPLMGNGRAGISIPPQHLLRIITLRITELSKQYDLPSRISINLADDCFEHLDLVEIKRGWSVV